MPSILKYNFKYLSIVKSSVNKTEISELLILDCIFSEKFTIIELIFLNCKHLYSKQSVS